MSAATSDILIAKIDATANEVDYKTLNVRGFPTIVFFPAKADKPIVEYNEERTLDGFVSFLRANAVHADQLASLRSADEL